MTKRHRLNASRIEQALKELKELAAELGFRVRDERLLGEVGYRVRSGACRVREEPTIFLDRKLPPRNRIEILADHLGSKLDGAELSEDLRQLVGRP